MKEKIINEYKTKINIFHDKMRIDLSIVTYEGYAEVEDEKLSKIREIFARFWRCSKRQVGVVRVRLLSPKRTKRNELFGWGAFMSG